MLATEAAGVRDPYQPMPASYLNRRLETGYLTLRWRGAVKRPVVDLLGRHANIVTHWPDQSLSLGLLNEDNGQQQTDQDTGYQSSTTAPAVNQYIMR